MTLKWRAVYFSGFGSVPPLPLKIDPIHEVPQGQLQGYAVSDREANPDIRPHTDNSALGSPVL